MSVTQPNARFALPYWDEKMLNSETTAAAVGDVMVLNRSTHTGGTTAAGEYDRVKAAAAADIGLGIACVVLQPIAASTAGVPNGQGGMCRFQGEVTAAVRLAGAETYSTGQPLILSASGRYLIKPSASSGVEEKIVAYMKETYISSGAETVLKKVELSGVYGLGLAFTP